MPGGRVRALLPALAAFLFGATCVAAAEGETVECQVLDRTAEGVYVDTGTKAGLEKGATGWLRRNADPIARFEIVEASSDQSYLRPTGGKPIDLPRAGERIVLILDAPLKAQPKPGSPSETIRDRSQSDAPFVPLLAPPDLMNQASTDVLNVLKGRITLRSVFQLASDEHDFASTRLGTSGSLDRIEGTPWSLEWSGDAVWRDGESYQTNRFHEELALYTYRFFISRRFDDKSFVRFGRFIPLELPSAGYLDGGQYDMVVNDRWRAGVIAGIKPDRDDLGLSMKEPTLVGYGTFQTGKVGERYYTGTAGLLLSLFDGEFDRFALLADQRLDLKKLSIYSSSEIDADVGGAVERDGIRLTRWDLFANYSATERLDLRGGMDHFELVDTAGERDVIEVGGLETRDFFQDSYWRYWVGLTRRMAWKLRLDAEAAYLTSEADNAFRWSASITREGLPRLGLSDGSATVLVYNLVGVRGQGYGARLSANLPFLKQRLVIQPALYVRFYEFESGTDNFFASDSEHFEVTDLSLRAFWTISKRWTATCGAAYTLSSGPDRVFVDLGITFRF